MRKHKWCVCISDIISDCDFYLFLLFRSTASHRIIRRERPDFTLNVSRGQMRSYFGLMQQIQHLTAFTRDPARIDHSFEITKFHHCSNIVSKFLSCSKTDMNKWYKLYKTDTNLYCKHYVCCLIIRTVWSVNYLSLHSAAVRTHCTAGFLTYHIANCVPIVSLVLISQLECKPVGFCVMSTSATDLRKGHIFCS